MKTFFLAAVAALFSLSAGAQVKSATLQASGLTCSMCSKAVLTALQKVPSVETVKVDIKNQQYHLAFKPEAEVELDDLAKAVSDAGFSVASLTVTAAVDPVTVKKDEHIRIGSDYVHILNASEQKLDGTITFTLADKNFTSEKNHKKWASMSKMSCVKTGRMEACCDRTEAKELARVYHAII